MSSKYTREQDRYNQSRDQDRDHRARDQDRDYRVSDQDRDYKNREQDRDHMIREQDRDHMIREQDRNHKIREQGQYKYIKNLEERNLELMKQLDKAYESISGLNNILNLFKTENSLLHQQLTLINKGSQLVEETKQILDISSVNTKRVREEDPSLDTNKRVRDEFDIKNRIQGSTDQLVRVQKDTLSNNPVTLLDYMDRNFNKPFTGDVITNTTELFRYLVNNPHKQSNKKEIDIKWVVTSIVEIINPIRSDIDVNKNINGFTINLNVKDLDMLTLSELCNEIRILITKDRKEYNCILELILFICIIYIHSVSCNVPFNTDFVSYLTELQYQRNLTSIYLHRYKYLGHYFVK